MAKNLHGFDDDEVVEMLGVRGILKEKAAEKREQEVTDRNVSFTRDLIAFQRHRQDLAQFFHDHKKMAAMSVVLEQMPVPLLRWLDSDLVPWFRRTAGSAGSAGN